MRVLREQDGRQIRLDGPLLARGGDASVYAVPDCPTLAARIFHNPTAEQAGKLAAMLAAPPVSATRSVHPAFAWPVERLLETEAEGRVAGYLMPRFEPAPMLWEVYNPGARLQIYPQFHYGSLLRVARHLAGAVHTLHQGGYVLGDLNESNVVVRPQALVTLIDMDSIQVSADGKLYRCLAARPEYTPPELQGTPGADAERRPEHDTFALAVLIFQLLMQGAHPFAGSCEEGSGLDSIPARIAAGAWPYAWDKPGPCLPSPHAPPWSVLPPAVQELLRCCFEDARTDPNLRPWAVRWQQALEEAENELTTCPHNAQHLYARGLDVCPWCVLARQQGRDPFPAFEEPWPDEAVPIAEENPPVPATTPSAKPGWVEAGLQKVGSLVERQGWLAWPGAMLVGTVAGLLWALQHAAPAAKDITQPVASTTPELAKPLPEAARDTSQQAQREALQVFQQASEAYNTALRAYQDAVNGTRQGRVNLQEVSRCEAQVQAEKRRMQAAGQALRDLTGGRPAPLVP